MCPPLVDTVRHQVASSLSHAFDESSYSVSTRVLIVKEDLAAGVASVVALAFLLVLYRQLETNDSKDLQDWLLSSGAGGLVSKQMA